MDAIIGAVLNVGGTGAMAFLLFLLHREAIRTFRIELRAERAENELARKEFLALKMLQHGEDSDKLNRILEGLAALKEGAGCQAARK